MLAKAELKLETGEVIPLQFGMYSQARFLDLFKPIAKPALPTDPTPDQRLRYDIEMSHFMLLVTAIIIASGAENARMNQGDIRPVQLHEAMNWIDLSGGIESEQVIKALSVNDFFKGESRPEAKPATKTPKKSPGRKSKGSQ